MSQFTADLARLHDADGLVNRLAARLGRSTERIREYGPDDQALDERLAQQRLYGHGSPARRGRLGVKGSL